MKEKTHSLQWGDRVDHKKFGLGTVEGEPEGDKVYVKWDNPDRTATSVVASFLQLVTRPDAKGGAFWSHEYSKLLEEVRKARAATDTALSSAFRPNKEDGTVLLDRALADEKIPLNAIREFLEQDEAGSHS